MDGQAPGPDGHQQPGLGPVRVVMLPSDLTFTVADQVRRELAAAVGTDVSMVVADGTQTVFFDSAGIRELVIAHRHATANGITFRVVVRLRYLRDRLIRLGLASYLPVYPTLGEALRADPPAELAAEELDPRPNLRPRSRETSCRCTARRVRMGRI